MHCPTQSTEHCCQHPIKPVPQPWLTALQVNALLDNEVLSMTREIDSTIQATANCMGQVRQPRKAGECHKACCTAHTHQS